MALRPIISGMAVFLLLTSGCKSHQHISSSRVTYTAVRPSSGMITDEAIHQLIAPYKEQLDEKMSEVIGDVAEEMKKEKPEGELGNWICDAMMRGLQRHGFHADLAVSNYGGIRVPQITAGPLTMGEVFELSPFENTVVIVDMPGDKLDSLFQHIAGTGGWPVSAGVKMIIRNDELLSATVHNQMIEKNTLYRVAMPDYVANGGDGSQLLTELSRTQTGILVRDMLIEDARVTAGSGGKIKAPVDGRTIKQN